MVLDGPQAGQGQRFLRDDDGDEGHDAQVGPQPGAAGLLRGQKVKLFDASLLPVPGAARPGEVLEVGEPGLAVALDGASLLVRRVQPEAAPKMPAGQFAAQLGLRPGERFES